MICTRCGNEMTDKCVCPCCGSSRSTNDSCHTLGNLSGGEETSERRAGDGYATGESKPMNDLISGDTVSSKTHADVTAGEKFSKSAKPFVWKRWMTVASSCGLACLLLLAGILLWGGSGLRADHAEELIRNELSLVMNYDENSPNPFVDTLLKGLAIDVLEIEKVDSGYSVTCVLTNYDVASAFYAVSQTTEQMSMNEYIHRLTKELENGDKIEKRVVIPVIYSKEHKTYSVQLTSEDLDAAMGGFISFFAQWGIGG